MKGVLCDWKIFGQLFSCLELVLLTDILLAIVNQLLLQIVPLCSKTVQFTVARLQRNLGIIDTGLVRGDPCLQIDRVGFQILDRFDILRSLLSKICYDLPVLFACADQGSVLLLTT